MLRYLVMMTGYLAGIRRGKLCLMPLLGLIQNGRDRQAVFSNNWIDAAPRAGKSSGAFSHPLCHQLILYFDEFCWQIP